MPPPKVADSPGLMGLWKGQITGAYASSDRSRDRQQEGLQRLARAALGVYIAKNPTLEMQVAENTRMAQTRTGDYVKRALGIEALYKALTEGVDATFEDIYSHISPSDPTADPATGIATVIVNGTLTAGRIVAHVANVAQASKKPMTLMQEAEIKYKQAVEFWVWATEKESKLHGWKESDLRAEVGHVLKAAEDPRGRQVLYDLATKDLSIYTTELSNSPAQEASQCLN